MSSNNGSAEIVDMEDARARRRAAQLPGADYAHAGAHMAAVREASGLPLAEAAEKTHIKLAHLAAIEEMNIDVLPRRPYAIGFVKTYAEFLGLDATLLVERFKEDAGFAAPPPIEVEKFEAAEIAAEAEKGDMSLPAVVVIIAFILWCAYQITLPHDVKVLGVEPGLSAGVEAPAGEPGVSTADPAAQPPLAVVVEARIIEQVEPVFPRRCADTARSVETVVVAFNVTASGLVTGEKIAQSSNSCLDAAALNALRRWRFEPRTVDGVARTAFDQKYSFSFTRPR